MILLLTSLSLDVEKTGLIILFLTLLVQMRELYLQRKQLKRQTDEFKKTAKAQKKYADAMNTNNEILNRQNLLSLMRTIHEIEKEKMKTDLTTNANKRFKTSTYKKNLEGQLKILIELMEEFGPLSESEDEDKES